MSEQEIINILSNFEGNFSIGDFFNFGIRWLGWAFIKLIAFLSDGMESIMDKIYTMNNFFDSEGIKNIINLFKPIIFVILGLSILYIGFQLVTNREFKVEKVINNITLSVMVIMLLPALMVNLNEATNYGISALKEGKVASKTTANQIIKSNLTDLYYLDNKDFKVKDNDNKNNLSLDYVRNIDINEGVDSNSVKNKKVFENKIALNEKNEKIIKKLDKGFFGLNKDVYYRYSFNFWISAISLLCSTLTLLLTSLKVARLTFELGFVKIFAIFYAFADIGNGNGIRQILKHILSTFAVIFSTALLLKLYALFTGFISSADGNEFLKMLLLASASIAVIDAPNIVERIFGIDAGLKSSWGLIAGAYSALKMGNELSKSISKIGEGVSSMGAGAKGIFDGFKSGSGENNSTGETLENQMDNGNNTSDSSPLNNDNNDNEDNNKKSSESVNMANDIKSLDEEIGTSKDDLNNDESDSMKNNLNTDSNDLNENANSYINDDYGMKQTLSEEMEGTSKPIDNLSKEESKGGPSTLENQMSNEKSPIGENNIGGIEDNNSNLLNGKEDNNSNLSNGNEKSSMKPNLGEDGIPNTNPKSSLDNEISKSNSIDGDSKNNINSNNIKPSNEKDSIGKDKPMNESNKGTPSTPNNPNNKSNRPIETRTYGEYFKDSKSMSNMNKHYQLGQNTGIKLRGNLQSTNIKLRENLNKLNKK